MTRLLKNGGWRNVGEFVCIRRSGEDRGIHWQVCSYTQQLDQDGARRSRNYYEVRFADEVVSLPASVKTLRAAVAECEKLAARKVS